MTDDPRSEFRCRCVHRAWSEDHDSYANSYYDRCHHQATQEDGKCDHCRQPLGACTACDGSWAETCCCRLDSRRRFVDLTEPCFDFTVAPL